MKRIKIFYPVFCMLALCLQPSAFMAEGSETPGEPLTVNVQALYDSPERYDGQRVAVTGEVIGDIMSDNEIFWINLKDGDAFIGIVIENADKEKIGHLGSYGIVGDTLRITGKYHVHCEKHMGERDIHAETLEVIRPGEILDEGIDVKKVLMSFILGILTIIFLVTSHRRAAPQDSGAEPF